MFVAFDVCSGRIYVVVGCLGFEFVLCSYIWRRIFVLYFGYVVDAPHRFPRVQQAGFPKILSIQQAGIPKISSIL